uniref:PID domain-containing protein n=1 Tax=Macrostomum lignano TaxID=282301 RepID=A0A1I8F8I7_9PLAT
TAPSAEAALAPYSLTQPDPFKLSYGLATNYLCREAASAAEAPTTADGAVAERKADILAIGIPSGLEEQHQMRTLALLTKIRVPVSETQKCLYSSARDLGIEVLWLLDKLLEKLRMRQGRPTLWPGPKAFASPAAQRPSRGQSRGQSSRASGPAAGSRDGQSRRSPAMTSGRPRAASAMIQHAEKKRQKPPPWPLSDARERTRLRERCAASAACGRGLDSFHLLATASGEGELLLRNGRRSSRPTRLTNDLEAVSPGLAGRLGAAATAVLAASKQKRIGGVPASRGGFDAVAGVASVDQPVSLGQGSRGGWGALQPLQPRADLSDQETERDRHLQQDVRQY